ncbi:MAG: ABC transporter ATP-binding protein [Deltaproteobacteria bacterium]|nr:ABC transporter ATP-binding protein [Deltaproteobacteria bacterium]
MLVAQNIHKTYREGDKAIAVLEGVNFEMGPRRRIGVVGASGVGKSTLLHILGGLDSPDTGKIFVEKDNLYQLSEDKRARLRNRYFGFVFQFYHLLPELTALENVFLPALIAGFSKKEAHEWASPALEQVGLKTRASHHPSELSGGEQQRVALARACVLKPKVILADEPTGNLDEKTGDEVLKFLLDGVEAAEGSLVLVTHNKELLKNCDEIFELKHGQLQKI